MIECQESRVSVSANKKPLVKRFFTSKFCGKIELDILRFGQARCSPIRHIRCVREFAAHVTAGVWYVCVETAVGEMNYEFRLGSFRQ